MSDEQVIMRINGWCGNGGKLAELAELIGVDPSFLSDVKAGVSRLGPEVHDRFWEVINNKTPSREYSLRVRAKSENRQESGNLDIGPIVRYLSERYADSAIPVRYLEDVLKAKRDLD